MTWISHGFTYIPHPESALNSIKVKSINRSKKKKKLCEIWERKNKFKKDCKEHQWTVEQLQANFYVCDYIPEVMKGGGADKIFEEIVTKIFRILWKVNATF